MASDPFSAVEANTAQLNPHLATDAWVERELLPRILDDARRFCESSVDGARIDREAALGPRLLSQVAERGWFGLMVPAAFGGSGLSLAAATRIVTELSAHNGSLGTCVGLHSGLALYALLHLATRSARDRYLSEVASGARITAFAATEPAAGSDISSVRTRLTEERGRLTLNGSKCYVTNGGICGLVTVLASSAGLGGARAGHTLVLVDPAWPGVSRGREEHKLGLKGASTLSIEFDAVEIPVDHVLGERSRGIEYAHRALVWGRTFLAAGCLGSASAALAAAGEHASTRVQFGRPLAEFPLVRHTLTEARARLYAMQSTLRLVCALTELGAADAALPSSILKILASEEAHAIVDGSLQLMGGAGYIEDAGMARRLRDIRVTRIFEGTNEVLRMHLVAAINGWPIKRLAAPRSASSARVTTLSTESKAFEESLGRLFEAILKLRKEWGLRLFEQQTIAYHLADAVVALFAALATLERAQAEIETSPASDSSLARLALHIHLRRAAASLDRALEPADPLLLRLIERATAEA